MMAAGVTGSAEPKMLPVMKTASAVAAMAAAAVRAASGEGDEDWVQVLVELADEGVDGCICRAGEGRAGCGGDGAGGCGAGDVDVASGVEGHGEADVAVCAEVGLGEDVGCCGVGLEEADAVLLVEQEVEIASSVGLDGVELGGELRVRGAEEAGE